jgi:predicted O-linked N-acetylglucosamine transferase (SPINDLY family)
VDIALDPFPFGGGVTTCDALWMGVPVVTCPGETFAGRHGLSHLANVGLAETVARDLDEYVELAASLAGDWPRLAALRAGLRQRMAASPLCDGKRFAANLITLLRDVWQQWIVSQGGRRPLEQPPPAAPEEVIHVLAVPQALDTAIQHHQAGRLHQAEEIYRQILNVAPQQVDALHLLGVVAHQTGRNDEALIYIGQALTLNPGQAKFHNTLAAVYRALGRLPESIGSLQQSVALNPNYAEAYNNLGMALFQQGQLAEASASLRRAVLLKPDYAKAFTNLGTILRAEGQIAEATTSYRRAVQLQEDLWEAHNGLGNVLKDQGQSDEAIACYKRALQLNPGYHRGSSNLLYALQYSDRITLGELAAAHAGFDRQFGDPLRPEWEPHGNLRDPGRRLRLGFLSPDLHRHPVGYFLVAPLEHLDPQQAETVCYSDSPDSDDLTARLRAAAATWRDTYTWSDERLASEIRADRIDILFDLAGHTGKNRLLVFARKPAPIQVTWAGYVGTTGLQAIDYILADPFEIPPEAEPHYRERVLRLPTDYVCYDPPEYAPPVSPLPALGKGYVTFGSFNNPAKLGPRTLEVWARILARIPQSRLVLKYKGIDGPELAGRLGAVFAGHGVDPGRVAFLGRSSHADALKHYQDIDIGLDPFPYNGGLTTLEALWMGVPVITCPGETFASRHSLTHLSNVGLTQTIARNLEEYVTLAVSLADDLPGLATVRAGLRKRMASSPVCDGKGFAANLMTLLRDIWQQWIVQG